jgi:octaprenyl-diphosphate synthase
MAIDLNYIKTPIKNELSEFNKYFRKAMMSDVFTLNLIVKYLLRAKGKQIRPILVFLSSRLFNQGETPKSSYVAATLIELMHTATLIHDDVVDEAKYRRGFLTLHNIWKSKVAVLMGDYLLSRGLLEAVGNSEYKLLEIVSEAVKEMSEGELLQIEKSKKLDIKEETYYDIITKKTATLIAACTKAGASSAGATHEQIENLKQFGLNIGIAFQIKDDLLDYDKSVKTGKSYGNDIVERKITLPLIYALRESDKRGKRKVLSILRQKAKTKNEINFVIDFAKSNGGIDYAYSKMNEYRDKALSNIKPYSDSDVYPYLEAFAYFVTERKK